MTHVRNLFFIVICALVASCAKPYKISSDYDSNTNFSTFKSYRWHEPNSYNAASAKYLNNDILDQRIRQKIDEKLQAGGYVQQESGEVDFLVNYTVSSEPRTDIRTYNTYGGFGPGWGFGYYGYGPYMYSGVGMASTETKVSHYQQGTLVLDIISPNSGKLLWRATAEGKIPKNMNRDERIEALDNVIGDVVSQFPPNAKQEK
ncbi:DUF4136 domain-containing protein [Bowmanella sp. Y26]|uniref:DUF4136 domain-containing protein n=1 Tax=Bowmanella yangjiangensis TaxID=2811230 RepID=UPI001BDD94A0|nr:DUF4136 domain-containing protein [Bowmanella yangjiangensis]MBT1063176.1 DUF4136 domain-containing protein [Bowmanella yangjiangensis]